MQEAEGEVVIEEEGYLRGKKILDDEEEDAATPTSPAGKCPFTGGMGGLSMEEKNGEK
jgi:hypothetical protein